MATDTHTLPVAGASARFGRPTGVDVGLDAGLDLSLDHGEHSYRGSNLLAGRVALVTGGDRGIGRAAAIAFAREGADVLIGCSEQARPLADATCRWVWQAGRRGVVIAGDLQSERHCARLVEAAVGTLGRLDVLANTAVVGTGHAAIERGRTNGDAAWKANVYPMFWLCRAALPCMEAGSVILNTAAIDASVPGADLAAYAATKAAVVNITRALSPVALRRGIRVNAVTPGAVRTPVAHVQRGARPAGAQPVDFAPLYVYLASDVTRVVPGDVYGPAGGVIRD